MNPKRCWIYNLTRNFLPFFIPFARRLEAKGLEPWWFNYWPNERTLISLNGFESRHVDWKTGWVENRAELSLDRVDTWLSTDPWYLDAPELAKAELRDRHYRFARHLTSTLRRLFADAPPACVCVWNGYRFPERVMVSLCREAGIPVFFFENGFFSHTMQIDPEGINAASSLSRRGREQWLQSPPDSEPRFGEFLKSGGKLPPPGNPLPPLRMSPVQRARAALRPFLAERRIYSTIPRIHPARNTWMLRQVEKRRAAKPSTRAAVLPERFIFLPFQVHDDTQIVVHSPWARTMRGMLEDVLEAKTALGLPHAVVVKEHPVDVGRFDYSNLETAPGVVWLRDYPLDEILRKSACVVTINSSVGIEALVEGCSVVTLGEAFYNLPGMVHHAAAKADLQGALKNALGRPVDRALQKAFLCRLRFHELVEASWGKPTDQGVENAANRVADLLNSPGA